MSPQTQLRNRLNEPSILVTPGVYDALGALLAQQAGFEACYLSGASISYARLGRPDIGLLGMSEVAEVITQIRERVALPLVVDADTGYGNALNVQRTVRIFERNGASAIQLEDQSLPKRCGHLDGKSVITTQEMTGKIKAALDARQNENTLIIARTDSIAVEGFDQAMERADAYVDAGADMLFVEALRDEAQMKQVLHRFSKRTRVMVNMVEGGNTPIRPAAQLEQLGFDMVIFPGGLVRALAKAGQQYFSSLKAHGSNEANREHMLDFQGINQLVGTNEMLEAGKKYDK